MNTSPEGLDLIKRFEGLRLTAYLCPAGVPTIGYGQTGPGIKLGMTITEAKANELLADSLKKYEEAVTHYAGSAHQNQFDAMVSLCYNIGAGNFKTSSVARLHKAGQYTGAASAFLLWNKAGGRVLAGLVSRRKAERNLYLGEVS